MAIVHVNLMRRSDSFRETRTLFVRLDNMFSLDAITPGHQYSQEILTSEDRQAILTIW